MSRAVVTSGGASALNGAASPPHREVEALPPFQCGVGGRGALAWDPLPGSALGLCLGVCAPLPWGYSSVLPQPWHGLGEMG